MHKAFFVLLLFSALAAAQMPVPTPPRVYLNTAWNPPSGATWHPRIGADLQNALNSAHPGDTIVLDAGSVYTGNFTLPAKANPIGQWIYIQSSALNRLPAPGVRVSPSDAPSMAKIVTPNGSPALNPSPGANYYRLVGLEVTTASNQGCQPHNTPPTNCFTYELFGQSDGGMNHKNNLPDSITFDRVYMHGSNTYDVREGIQGNVTNLAVIDSYISDIHQSTMDSQAIAVYLNPGPIKIVNNFLSASTEDVMFGGAGGFDDPYIPSDIEIRRNHFFKPLAWDSCGAGGTLSSSELQPNGIRCPAGLGYQWVEKNNLEFKSARRVVVTGNTFENTWTSAQVGYSVLFTIRTSQSGNIAVVDDIELASNILQNVDRGFSTLEQDDQCGPPSYPSCTNKGESKRIWVHNNLILLSTNLDVGSQGHNWAHLDGGSSHLGDAGLTDYVFQHNTALVIDGSKMWGYIFSTNQSGCPPTTSSTHNLWILDNVFARQPTGDCGYQGTTGLGYYMGDPSPLAPRYLGNVMFVPSGDPIATWPVHNYATTVPFTYVNPGGGDDQLLTPYWTDTSDGQLSGIDWDALQAAMGDSTLSIVTTSLPPGVAGVAYSATLAATGGTAPYSWSITAGSLPTGVRLGSSTGIISGTPTAPGTFSFTATVADSASPPNVASVGLSITITGSLHILTTSLPAGVSGVAYSATLAATGGTAPYSWSITAGALPTGVSLGSSTGIISGTPTAQGTFSFTATVADSASPPNVASVGLSITITGSLHILTTSLPPGQVGKRYGMGLGGVPLSVAGGVAPYTWSVIRGKSVIGGNLPMGLSLSSHGLIVGTPSASGQYTFTVSVNDSEIPPASASAPFTIVVGH
jgi:hypothetical protein